MSDGVVRMTDAVSLETMREANVAFYRRHGFEVAATFALAGGGPTCWVMRRAPQS